MPRVSFTVYGPPVPKARPRVTRGRAYTPERSKGYEETVTAHAVEAMNRAGLEMAAKGVPVKATLRFEVPMPASWSTRKKRRTQLTIRTVKPDCDNYEKAILDACNGIVYADDGQVGIWSGSKRWAGLDQDGAAHVTFEWGEHLT